jgi:hypothetical protein
MMTEQYPSGDVEIGFHSANCSTRGDPLHPSGDVEIGFHSANCSTRGDPLR